MLPKLLFLSLLFLSLSLSAQDTTIIKEVRTFNREDISGFDFFNKVKFGEKHITYDDNLTEVMWCYFVDTIEHCHSQFYKLISPNTIKIGRDSANSSYWNYKKSKDSLYLVTSSNLTTTTVGRVSTLIPFKKTGKFYTTSQLSNDTLWIADYSIINYDGPSFFLTRYEHPANSGLISIYNPDALDSLPKWNNGDSITKLPLKRSDYCINESLQAFRTLKFIIDADGIPHNFQQYEGNFELFTCPFYFHDIIETLLAQSPFSPGIKDGQPVNSYCYIEIDMLDDYLNEFAKHPALDHDYGTKKKVKNN